MFPNLNFDALNQKCYFRTNFTLLHCAVVYTKHDTAMV